MTRYGIERDLTQTPYKYDIPVSGDILRLHFSSDKYLEKYPSRMQEYRDKINKRIYDLYALNLDSTELAIVYTYLRLETRGCLIKRLIDGSENDFIVYTDHEQFTFSTTIW